MGKRGNGEGSISRRKGGGWMGQYVVHTADGSNKRKTVYGKTRAEVASKLARALSQREDGLVFDDEGLTVEKYLGLWLKNSVRDTVRTSTYERNEQIVNLHVVPALGRLKLKALTPAQVRWFYREKLDTGLSSATVHKMHVVLHKALDQAVRDGLIPRNVTEAVKVPQVRRKEIEPLSAEETKRLLATASEAGDRFEALYVLTVTTGLRQGELLALRWDDVDLEGGVLRVRRTLTRVKGSYSLGEPKTARSRRSVSLTASAVEALRKHLDRQLEEIDRMGSGYQDGGLVFATERGDRREPVELEEAILCAAAGACEVAGDPVPRPPAHLRDAAAHQERQPQGRLRDARTRQYRDNPRHLLSRTAQHARQRGPGAGGSVEITYPTQMIR